MTRKPTSRPSSSLCLRPLKMSTSLGRQMNRNDLASATSAISSTALPPAIMGIQMLKASPIVFFLPLETVCALRRPRPGV